MSEAMDHAYYFDMYNIESANIFINYKWQYELFHTSNEHINLAWTRCKFCVQQMKKKA